MDIFKLLTEDDDDTVLILHDEETMYAAVQQLYGVNPRSKMQRTTRAQVIKDNSQSRLHEILSHRNQLIENHPDFSCSQLKAMKVLHSLTSIRMWSLLYKASIQHLQEDSGNRQTFLSYEDDENKVLYLEFVTGESRDA
ncbi:uncharacterized protein LOC108810549 isoform X2 [Raphanus sativus]|uniref:Uncharacterized protein LOC108810549 isoform X2 n=1 Tax=Raphanus sativus TaxID=3726 RepID=A0A9W3BWB8_RAPSA|nr:uncharacterized protein LOC108810549 isoform X2 [Raphanus sativus]